MSVCCVIGGAVAKGVNFASGDYMSRSALTGATNNDTGTISVWARFNGTGVDNPIFLIRTGDGFNTIWLHRLSNDHVRCEMWRNTSSPFTLGWVDSDNACATATWIHILVSFDISAGAGSLHLYIDDVDADAAPFKDQNGNVVWDGTTVYVGKNISGGAETLDGDIADLWVNNTYMNLDTESNRRKFISASGRPVPLGANGELPTGSSPLVFLRGPASGFATNLGTGGNFTVTGGLSDSTSHPP